MIGNRLKERRLAMGATQAEIARRLEVSPQYYSHLELNDEVPSIDTLITVADILGCSVDFLLSGGDNIAPVIRETGKYLKKTYKGWACTAKVCPWRDQTGFCNSGAGCMKEWEEQHGR